MDISFIKTGHRNAVKIPNYDCATRRAIAEANKNGDCIINVGYGYYRPDMTDEIDRADTEYYFARELHRARESQYKRLKMMESVGMRNGKKDV